MTRWSLVALGALGSSGRRLRPVVVPVRRFVRTKLERVPQIRRWEAAGEQVEARGRRAARQFLTATLDDLFVLLGRNQSTWSFVDEVVRHLVGNREVRGLVDDIVAYLVDHPSVLALVREQSTGFTDEVVQAGRDRLARADNVVDHVVASLRKGLRLRDTTPTMDQPPRSASVR